MDAGRRHKTPGLETKGSERVRHFMLTLVFLAPSPMGAIQSGPSGHCVHSKFMSQLRKPKIGNP